MSEAVEQESYPKDDEGLKRAVAESLDDLDREGKRAVLRLSRDLRKGKEPPNAGAIKLLEEWMAEDPAYDREVLPELMEALDRDRLGYRKFFE